MFRISCFVGSLNSFLECYINKKLELELTDMWDSVNLDFVQVLLNHSSPMFPAYRKWSFDLKSKLIDLFRRDRSIDCI